MVSQQTQWQYWWRGASPPSLFSPSSLRIRSGIEEYYCSYSISTDTVAILVERVFTSLSLHALLPPHQIRYRGVTLLLWSLNRHSGDTGGEGLHLPVSSRPPPSIRSGIEEYRRSYGLSTGTTEKVVTTVEMGFTSLILFALLPLHQIRYRGVPPILWSLNRHSGNTGGEGLHLSVSSRPPPSASNQV
jgi:hypothetical protein